MFIDSYKRHLHFDLITIQLNNVWFSYVTRDKNESENFSLNK